MYEVTNEILEITPLPNEGNIQVAFIKHEFVDSVEISKRLHYELYSSDKKEQFLIDVPNGQPYVDAIGW